MLSSREGQEHDSGVKTPNELGINLVINWGQEVRLVKHLWSTSRRRSQLQNRVSDRIVSFQNDRRLVEGSWSTHRS